MQKSIDELEKKGQALERLKSVKWFGEDPNQIFKEQVEYLKIRVNNYVKNVHNVEDRVLREGFCMAFLSRFGYFPKGLAIPEIYDYVNQLLLRKTDEYNKIKELLNRGLVLFGV